MFIVSKLRPVTIREIPVTVVPIGLARKNALSSQGICVGRNDSKNDNQNINDGPSRKEGVFFFQQSVSTDIHRVRHRLHTEWASGTPVTAIRI